MRVLGIFVTAGALLTLLSAAVVAQELGLPSDTPITTADCEQAWDASSASASCRTLVLAAESSVPGADLINNCAVKALCADPAGAENDIFSDYHGGPEGVEQLQNCGGRLSIELPGHAESEGC